MVVRVTLSEEFMLTETAGRWSLPEVVIRPGADFSTPTVLDYQFTISGAPESVRARLEQVYAAARSRDPLPLTGPRSIAPTLIERAGRLPERVSCQLTVSVRYMDPTTPLQGTLVERRCRLYAPAASRDAHAEAGANAAGPRVTVRPTDLAVAIGEPAAKLYIEVSSATPETPPRVALATPDALVPDDALAAISDADDLALALREVLEEALRVRPRRSTMAAGTQTYTLDVALQLGDLARSSLEALLKRNEPFRIALVTEVPGAEPVRHWLRPEVRSNQFKGWLAIDFGTANSTMVAYDLRTRADLGGRLAEEREDALRRGLQAWLAQPAADALPPNGRRHEARWREFVARVGPVASRPAGESAANGGEGYASPPIGNVYAFLWQLERVALNYGQTEFYTALTKKLFDIYDKAFDVPPLRQLNFYPVALDPNRKKDVVLISEMRIDKDQDATASPLSVGIGPEVRSARQQVVAGLSAAQSANADELQAELSSFIPSPKRYLGADQGPEVRFANGRARVEGSELMKAAWNRLIELASQAQAGDREFGSGEFRRAVVTYPTVSPPNIRRDIEQIFEDLGINFVQTDFDEAVSAAIFYMMCGFGHNLDYGIDAFRGRCRLMGSGARVQNVLVFDIGGGTTDLALIELRLTDETPPFASSTAEEQACGRYYKITPTLLASSGNMRLGGQLMTLRVFRLLKAKLADHLLTLIEDGSLQSPVIRQRLSEFEETFKQGGKYRPGSLLACIDRDDLEQDTNAEAVAEAALRHADMILPTRWQPASQRRDARAAGLFYKMWEAAESAKIKLCGNAGSNSSEPQARYQIREDVIEEWLHQHCDPDARMTAEGLLSISLDRTQVERAICPVVREAVDIADGLLNHVASRPANGDGHTPSNGVPWELDWLILSGNACHLTAVERELRRRFRDKPYFAWNPERVTFDPRYAKLGPAIGACYGHLLRQFRYDPNAAIKQLRHGENCLYFDVNNLFRHLPCEFWLERGDNPPDELFRANTDLYQIDDLPLAKARSEWASRSLQISVHRRDYAGQKKWDPWGHLHGEALVKKLGITEHEWLSEIKLQFEVDHRLVLRAALCWGDPHYQIRSDASQCDVGEALERARAAAPADIGVVQEQAMGATGIAENALIDADETLRLSIGYTSPVNDFRETLFAAGCRLDRVFHAADGAAAAGEELAGAISDKTLGDNEFPDHGRIKLEAFDDRQRYPLGDIERPRGGAGFLRRNRFSLDARGILRLHPGEVPYAETSELTDIRRQPGRVCVMPLDKRRDLDSTEFDPFCGQH